jgi:hypothetical protein
VPRKSERPRPSALSFAVGFGASVNDDTHWMTVFVSTTFKKIGYPFGSIIRLVVSP